MVIDAQKLRKRLPLPPQDGNPAMESELAPERVSTVVIAAPRERFDIPRGQDVQDGNANLDATPRLDGRRLRATHRTTQLNLKVRQETRDTFLRIASERGVLMAELFEEAVDLLQAAR